MTRKRTASKAKTIGPPPRKQYRNLRPELAPPDDEIYRLGFVVGGKRLKRFEPKEGDK